MPGKQAGEARSGSVPALNLIQCLLTVPNLRRIAQWLLRPAYLGKLVGVRVFKAVIQHNPAQQLTGKVSPPGPGARIPGVRTLEVQVKHRRRILNVVPQTARRTSGMCISQSQDSSARRAKWDTETGAPRGQH